MPWRLQSQPTPLEKACAGLSYVTFGITGLLYMLFSKRNDQSDLFRFHLYQAVFLSLLSVMISWAIWPLLGIILNIMQAVAPAAVSPTESAIFWIARIISSGFYLLLLYGAVWAFLGKFAEVPVVSDMIRTRVR
jgi:uncharacterized membrane protein